MAEIPKYAILDGGLATELERRGCSPFDTDPLWSSKLLITDKKAVYDVHISWLEAGADIIETNTYQATIEGFKQALGVSEKEASQVIADGCRLAVQARDDFWSNISPEIKTKRCKPLVAGSCGPYGVSLCDGSEYSGNYVKDLSQQELVAWHSSRIQAVLDGGVDLVAFDTIPALAEAKAIITAMAKFSTVKFWICFSCKDGSNTCSNESVSEVFCSLISCDQLLGFGFNCTAPWYITSLLKEVQGIQHNKIVIVYPNSGEDWTRETQWSINEKCTPIHKYVNEWRSNGAQWIGGCCRITTEDVSLIKHAFYESS